MINLKEQEAVEYLSRMKSTLDGRVDSSGVNLLILQSMVQFEILYLQRLLDKGVSDTVLPIGASGFPDLDSWLGDLEKLMGEYRQITVSRTRAVLPLIEQLTLVKPQAIRQEGHDLAKMWQQDYPFVAAIGEASTNTIDTLSEGRVRWMKKSFPFTYPNTNDNLSSAPFLLVGVQDTREKKFKRVEEVYRLRGAYKYIDAKPGSQEMVPHTLYIRFDEYHNLYDRTVDELSKDGFTPLLAGINGYSIGTYINLVKEGKMELSEPTLATSENFQQLQLSHPHRAFMDAYIKLDTNTLSDVQISTFLQALIDLSKLHQSSRKFLDSLVGGALTIKAEDITLAHQEWSQKLESIFDSLKNDYLKMQAQTVWAQAMLATRNRMESSLNQQLSVEQPSKLKGGIKFLPWRKG